MATIAEIRSQHPGAYDDMNDVQLADALHAKFYADMPRDQFDAKVGLKAAPPPAAEPVAPKSNEALGVLDGLVNVARNVNRLNPMTGFRADPHDNLPGYKRYLDAKKAKGVVPGEIGRTAAEIGVGVPLAAMNPWAGGAAIGALSSRSENLGGMATDAAIGSVFGKAGDKAARMLGSYAKTMKLPQLQAAKDAAYRAVDDIGVRYTPKAIRSFVTGASDELSAARLNPMRHPKAASMLAEIKQIKGPVSLSDLDSLRQTIGRDVAGAADRAERFFGKKLIKNLDEFIDSAGPGQVTMGDPKRAAGAIAQARDLNTRFRKVEALETAKTLAAKQAAKANSGGNRENALRQQVDRATSKMKNLSPAEKAAADRAVAGAPLQNILRSLGKLSPEGNGLMLGAHLAALPLTHGVSGAAAAGGAVSKVASELLTRANVEALIRAMANGGTPVARKAVSPLIRAPISSASAQTAIHAKNGLLGVGQ